MKRILLMTAFLVEAVFLLKYGCVIKQRLYECFVSQPQNNYTSCGCDSASIQKALEEYSALTDEEDAWYTKYRVISHAGGEIEGHIYTNSLEAWNHSYSRGDRVFDADLIFTSDSVLVVRHDWWENLEQTSERMNQHNTRIDVKGMQRFKHVENMPLAYKEFKDNKIFGRYTPMSASDMLLYMHNHQDLYIAADAKDDVLRVYKELICLAQELNIVDVLDRIIVNIYEYEMYDSIMRAYKFPHTTIRQSGARKKPYEEILAFCVEKNIHVINITPNFMEPAWIDVFVKKGIHPYFAVVDYMSDMKYYEQMGFWGCVSNLLHEDMFKSASDPK